MRKCIRTHDDALFFFLLSLLFLLLPGILQDIRHLYRPFIGLLRSLQVCPELLLDSREIFIGKLCIRILFHVRPLGLEEVHKVLQSDIELPHYLV